MKVAKDRGQSMLSTTFFLFPLCLYITRPQTWLFFPLEGWKIGFMRSVAASLMHVMETFICIQPNSHA